MTNMPDWRNRLFSDFYTPLRQGAFFRGSSADEVEHDYVAQLRLDTLLARQVVIPDTYLLDGKLFVRIHPEDFFKRLGLSAGPDRAGIEFQLRADSMEESLHRLLYRPDKDHLAGFPFNFLSDEAARDALATALEDAGPTAVREHQRLVRANGAATGTAKLLRQYLRSVGRQDVATEVDDAERAWLAWIEADKQGRLPKRVYDSAHFDVQAGMTAPFDRAPPVATLLAKDLLSSITTVAHRADVARLIRDARSSASDEQAVELELIEAWYTRARHRALANQHQAVLARSETPETATRGGPLHYEAFATDPRTKQPRDGPTIVAVPEYFIDGLAGMSGDRFSQLRRECRRERERWLSARDVDALRSVVTRVDLACRSAQIETASRVALSQFFVAALGAGAAGAAANILAKAGEVATSVHGVPISIVAGLVTLVGSQTLNVTSARRARNTIVEYSRWRLGEIES